MKCFKLKNVCLILLVMALYLSMIPTIQTQKELSGNITFQPNSIPDVKVYYENHTFVFELEKPQKTFFIRVEPFVIHDGKFYNMTQIIKFLKSQGWLEGNYKKLIDKTVNAIHYGYNITSLPKNVADKIDFLGFRLVDLNFPLSWFKLETLEVQPANITEIPYNITIIKIPKAHLVFAFEDLYPYGYEIQHINSTYILIGNVKGRTELFVDPIVASGDYIITTGSYSNLHQNLWEADKNGTFSLHDRDNVGGLDNTTVSPTNSLRPADYVELGGTSKDLYITVENWSNMTNATVQIVGTDRNQSSVSENITITGNGDYYLTEKYATISTQVVEFNDNITTWDLIDEPWDALGNWTEIGTGVSEISPAGQLHLLPDQGMYVGRRYELGDLPNQYTIGMNLSVDEFEIADFSILSYSGIKRFNIYIFSDKIETFLASGLNQYYIDTAENTWYIWRFLVDITGEELKIYRDSILLHTFTGEFQSYAGNDGRIDHQSTDDLLDPITPNAEAHQDYINFASGFMSFDYELIQGQWGCIWKTGEANYKVDNCVIQIGDDVTSTTCSDLSVNVLFETDQRDGYVIKNNAELIFGQQDSGYATSHGVNINWNSSYGSYNTRIFYGSSSANSKLNLYSCSLKSTYHDYPDPYISGIDYFSTSTPNVVIYNCLFDKVYPTGYCDIYNLAIFRGLHGLYRVDGALQQIFLYDVRYAITVDGASKTVKDVNIIAVDSLTGIRYTGGGNDHYLVNVDWSGASYWKFYWHYSPWGDVYRQYEFVANITDGNSPIQNANVTIYDNRYNNGTWYNVGSWLTWANGTFPVQTLTKEYFNQSQGDVPYSYEPINITITANGYQTHTQNFTLSEETSLIIALEETPTVGISYEIGLFAGSMGGLIIGLLFTFYYIRARKETDRYG